MSRALPNVAAAEDRAECFRAALTAQLRRHSLVSQGHSVECYRCGASGTWDDKAGAWTGNVATKECAS